ncbi:hypothetical protein D9M70_487060 [compost metagenome]
MFFANQPFAADAECSEEALRSLGVAGIGATEGAITAGNHDTRLGVALGERHRLDETVRRLVEFHAAAACRHLVLEGAAEHDDAGERCR